MCRQAGPSGRCTRRVTPEIQDSTLGAAARTTCWQLAPRVELQVVDTDRYGRTVAKVYRDGRDINREMIREGHAWVYRKYLRDPSLLEDERQARGGRAGLLGLT